MAYSAVILTKNAFSAYYGLRHVPLHSMNRVFVRNRITTDTGAFLPQPKKINFGLLRVLFTVLPGLYLGATISKEAAAFLEENDIFVPDEDDDED